MIVDPDTATAMTAGLWEERDRYRVATHSHRRAQLLYAKRGVLNVLAAKGSWTLPPMRAIFIPAGTQHALDSPGPVTLATLYIDPEADGLPEWTECKVIDASDLLRALTERLVKAPWDYEAKSPLYILAQAALVTVSEAPDLPLFLPEPVDKRAKRFCGYMRMHLDDPRPLTQIAAEIGSSYRTLERLFKDTTGMGVGGWVQQLRLVSGLQKLAMGEPVGRVSFDVGYGSPSAFTSSFRKFFGLSPTAFLSTKGRHGAQEPSINDLKTGAS